VRRVYILAAIGLELARRVLGILRAHAQQPVPAVVLLERRDAARFEHERELGAGALLAALADDDPRLGFGMHWDQWPQARAWDYSVLAVRRIEQSELRK